MQLAIESEYKALHWPYACGVIANGGKLTSMISTRSFYNDNISYLPIMVKLRKTCMLAIG